MRRVAWFGFWIAVTLLAVYGKVFMLARLSEPR